LFFEVRSLLLLIFVLCLFSDFFLFSNSNLVVLQSFLAMMLLELGQFHFLKLKALWFYDLFQVFLLQTFFCNFHISNEIRLFVFLFHFIIWAPSKFELLTWSNQSRPHRLFDLWEFYRLRFIEFQWFYLDIQQLFSLILNLFFSNFTIHCCV